MSLLFRRPPDWLDQLASVIGDKRYVVTQAGDPKRRSTVFLPLLVRWAQHRFVRNDPAPYVGKAKPQRWQVVKRA